MNRPDDAQFEAMLALAQREVLEMWAPHGDALIEAFIEEADGNPRRVYNLLCEALLSSLEERTHLKLILERGAAGLPQAEA